MGDWAITICGRGSHHNSPNGHNEYDADQIARECVTALWKAGHIIKSATFTFGNQEEIAILPDANKGDE